MENSRKEQFDIVIIGAGNVAFNLAQGLKEVGNTIVQIIGHSSSKASELAAIVGCDYALSLNEVNNNAHLYIIAVPDSAIPEVVSKLLPVNGVVVHTSGSTPLSVFTNKFENYGVFYPFQTFSKNRRVSFTDVPFFIESNNPDNLLTIKTIVDMLKAKSVQIDYETRKWIHLSGVFSSNFVNHMLAIASMIADEKGFDFGMLKPLVTETVKKALESGDPIACQTGPAIRGDFDTMKKHLAMLSTINEDIRELYMSLSTSIWQLEHGDE